MRATARCGRLTDERMGTQLFWLCWIMYAVSYLGRYNYSGAMAAMIADGVLTTAMAGSVATAYFALYGIGQLVNGWLAGVVSPFTLMLFGAAAAGIANLLMPLCPSGAAMLAVWAVNGFAQATVWPAALRILIDVLPKRQLDKACVNICSAATAGNLAACGLVWLCLQVWNWHGVFLLSGVCLLAAACVWRAGWRRFRLPDDLPDATKARQRAERGSMFRTLAVSGALALILPIVFHGLLRDGVSTWLPTYLVDGYGVTPAAAAALSAVLPVVNLAGVYMADYLNRRMRNEAMASAGLFALAAALIARCVWGNPLPLMGTVACLSGATAAMLGVNALLITFVPVRLDNGSRGTLYSGIFNALAYLGGAVSPTLAGVLLAGSGWLRVQRLWVAVAALGALICVLCIPRWGRYRRTADLGWKRK